MELTNYLMCSEILGSFSVRWGSAFLALLARARVLANEVTDVLASESSSMYFDYLTKRSLSDAQVEIFDDDIDRRNTTQTCRRHCHRDAGDVDHRDHRLGERRPPEPADAARRSYSARWRLAIPHRRCPTLGGREYRR